MFKILFIVERKVYTLVCNFTFILSNNNYLSLHKKNMIKKKKKEKKIWEKIHAVEDSEFETLYTKKIFS